MGFPFAFDFVQRSFKPLESRALIVVLSDRLALLTTRKVSSSKMLTNAQAAGMVLVLDQLEAKLEAEFVLTQHIRDVLNLESYGSEKMERRLPRQLFTELGPSRMSCTCARDTVSCLIHWLRKGVLDPSAGTA